MRVIPLITFALFEVITFSSNALAATCRAGPSVRSPDTSIKAEIAIDASARTGEPARLQWQITQPPSSGDAYLLVGFSDPTRFKGDGFVAIPPRARAPRSIDAQTEKTRLIVPLSGQLANADGTASVLFYVSGQKTITWDIVVLSPGPSQACNATIRASGTLQSTVTSGVPQFVTQDRFTLGTPKAASRSSDDRFLLLEFSDRFQILDSKTGDFLFERAGNSPRFSPSGRYITSSGGSGRSEVLDVPAQRLVFATDAVLEGNFGGPTVTGWMNHDAFLVLGYGRKGAIGISIALIDERNLFTGDVSCNACQGFGSTSLEFDFDQLAFRAADHDPYMSSLLEVADSPQSVAYWDTLPEKERGSPPKRPKYPLKQYQPINTVGDQLVIPKTKDSDSVSWRFSDPIAISSSSVWNGDVGAQRALLASKTYPTLKVALDTDTAKFVARGKVTKRTVTSGNEQLSPKTKAEKLAAAIAPFRVSIVPALPKEPTRPIGDRNENYDAAQKSAEKVLREAMSVLSNGRTPLIFRSQANQRNFQSTYFAKNYGADLGACVHDELPEQIKVPEQNDENAENPPVISADQLKAIWTFPMVKGTLVIAQQQTSCGTSPDRYGDIIAVFAPADKSAPLKHVRLAAAYSDAGDPSDPSGIDAQRARLGASLALDFRPDLQVSLIGEMFLVIASKDSGAAAVFEATSMKHAALIENMDSPLDLAILTMTTDHQTLVQMNNGGGLAFYAVKSGQKVLHGRFLDDEIALFDTSLKYESSSEGAAYVYVQIPGANQLYTLDQFSSKLYATGLASRKIYTTAADEASQSLAPPSLNVDRTASSFHVSMNSETALAELRVVVDGDTAQTIALTGSAAAKDIAVDLLPAGRWISFVAFDTQGLRSVTRSFELSAKPYIGALRVIAFGADRFNRAKLGGKPVSDLSYGSSDARRFEKGLKQYAASYATYTGSVLTGGTVSAPELISRIREYATLTKRGDTLVLFLATHGYTSNGSFRLLLPGTSAGEGVVEVPFSDIVQSLRPSQGRIFVFLDACHSADATQDTASEQLVATNQNLTIISASKGRQTSRESPTWGGGIFTTAVLDALKAARRQGPSARLQNVGIDALYATIRKHVLAETNGQQTPWFRRTAWLGEQSIN